MQAINALAKYPSNRAASAAVPWLAATYIIIICCATAGCTDRVDRVADQPVDRKEPPDNPAVPTIPNVTRSRSRIVGPGAVSDIDHRVNPRVNLSYLSMNP